MSFLHIWHFSQDCRTHHKATPHFVEICFRLVQTRFFLLPPSLIHNLSRQTFISAYKLYKFFMTNRFPFKSNFQGDLSK